MANPYRAQPIRYQIRKNILDYLIQNGYQPGDQLPPEHELEEIFKVSRFSLREALNLLEVERVITTKHGSGRYLISFPDEFGIDITKLQGVTELLESYGIEAAIQLDHAQAAIRATLLHNEMNEPISDSLTPWILLEQVIYDRDGKPIIFSKDYHQADHIVFHVRRYRR